MNNTEIVPVTALVSNVFYTEPDNFNHYEWKKPGETINMPFADLRRMFGEHPAYKNWLCPAPEVFPQLGLTKEHYQRLQAKYQKQRQHQMW